MRAKGEGEGCQNIGVESEGEGEGMHGKGTVEGDVVEGMEEVD